MPTFDVPETFDPNNLQHLCVLVDNLRAARCKRFKHPGGLEIDLDTSARAPVTLERPTGDNWGE